MRSQIEIAIAAALSVNLPLFWAFTRRGSEGRPNPLTLGEVGVLLLVVGCYLTIPLIISTLRKRRIVQQVVPVWLWVSVAGAALLVVADYALEITYGIRAAEQVAKEWFVLSVFTSPVTALVHYSKAIVEFVKRWHEGHRDNLSIAH